jgi:16S rRNA (guanine527-N7)-methyltransferase
MLPFDKLLSAKGFNMTSIQLEQFHTYYELLIEWNEKMNLTAITDKEDVYLKHFYDSVTPSFIFDFKTVNSLCDVGAGAGFPSLPIKILFPHLEISIVDSLMKRITFLETLVNTLNLENVSLHHDRAEIFGQNSTYRESFDVVTARAVARLNVLSELCLPLVKVSGNFIALKGAMGEEEVSESQDAISKLGGQINKVEAMALPKEESRRHLIIIDKVKSTSKRYPRKPGVPAKQPL